MGWTHSSLWARGRFQDLVNSPHSMMSSAPDAHASAVIRLTWSFSRQQSPECSLVGINCHEDRTGTADMEILTCDIPEQKALPVMGTAGLGCLLRNCHSGEERFPKKPHLSCVSNSTLFSPGSFDKNLRFLPPKIGVRTVRKDFGTLSAWLKLSFLGSREQLFLWGNEAMS